MANYALAADSNFSTCNGGGAPGTSDNIYLNGYHLHMDVGNVSANVYTVTSISATTDGATASAGYLVLDNATTTINANLKANADDLITLAATGKTLTTTGTNTSGSTASKRCIYVSAGTHTLTVNNCTAGSAANAHGLYIGGGTVTLAVNGKATGGEGSGSGISIATSITGITLPEAEGGSAAGSCGVTAVKGTFTVTQATGGGAATAHGVNNSGGTVTIGTSTGGSVMGACGVLAQLGTTIVNACTYTGVGYPTANNGGTLKVAAGVMLAISDDAGSLKKFYGPELLPDPAGVLESVSYGLDADKANYGTTAGTAAGTLSLDDVLDPTGHYVAPVNAEVLRAADGGTGYGAEGGTAGTLINCPVANAQYTGTAYYGKAGALVDGLLTLPNSSVVTVTDGGADNPNVAGTYVRTADWDGYPCWTNGTYFIWWGGGGIYVINDVKGDPTNSYSRSLPLGTYGDNGTYSGAPVATGLTADPDLVLTTGYYGVIGALVQGTATGGGGVRHGGALRGA